MLDKCTNETLTINTTSIPPQKYKGNTRIKKIYIGKEVEVIGAEAFSGCSRLESIEVDADNARFTDGGCNAIIDKKTGVLLAGCYTTVIPEIVKEVGPFAFCGQAQIKKLLIPANVEKLDAHAFDGCTGLLEIDIKAGVKTIGDNCFRNCGKIETVYIPDTLEEVSSYVFGAQYEWIEDDENLTSVCVSPLLKIKDIYYTGTWDAYHAISLENKFRFEQSYLLTVHFGDGSYWESIPSEDWRKLI